MLRRARHEVIVDGEAHASGATMPIAKPAVKLHGSCHCGELRIEFSTAVDLAGLVPRACDCSFCRKHGAAYISDPAGRLSIAAKPGALRRYRQGSNHAEFLVCARCGVLVAVIFEHGSRIHGALNAGCLDDQARLAQPVAASPQKLGADEKMSRWLKLWIADVTLDVAGD